MQRALVTNDLELHPVGQADLTSHASRADRLVRRIATGRIRKQEVLVGINVVEQRFLAAVEVHATHSHGHHLRTARLDGPRGFGKGLVFSSSDDQAGAELTAGND